MLAALVLVTLLAAVVGGLVRAGSGIGLALGGPLLQTSGVLAQATGAHAALMLSGFLGMVIAVERAVAVQRRWAWAAPLGAGLFSLALLAGAPALAAGCGLVAALVSVAVHALVLRRQRAAHTALLLLAAITWLVGNALFAVHVMAGRPTADGTAAALPGWFALPVLTIAAERLEMTRLTRRHALAVPVLLAIVTALLTGAALVPFGGTGGRLGGVLFGSALTALALWFGAFDIARRTLFAAGLARYMAVCLLAGYAWLALAGLAWVGMVLGCPGRDLALHALGLGFIVSMVMGHAPVILPAVARTRLLFGPWFYAPLLALHGSLLLRLVGGIGHPGLRTLGAELNAAALALFALTVAGSAVAWRLRPAN